MEEQMEEGLCRRRGVAFECRVGVIGLGVELGAKICGAVDYGVEPAATSALPYLLGQTSMP